SVFGELLKPSLLIVPEQRLAGAEHRIELGLDLIGLIDDDEIAAPPDQFEIPQLIAIEFRRYTAVHQSGGRGHPRLCVDELTRVPMTLTSVPQWASIGVLCRLIGTGFRSCQLAPARRVAKLPRRGRAA